MGVRERREMHMETDPGKRKGKIPLEIPRRRWDNIKVDIKENCRSVWIQTGFIWLRIEFSGGHVS
jgi:hypothetical protein